MTEKLKAVKDSTNMQERIYITNEIRRDFHITWPPVIVLRGPVVYTGPEVRKNARGYTFRSVFKVRGKQFCGP